MKQLLLLINAILLTTRSNARPWEEIDSGAPHPHGYNSDFYRDKRNNDLIIYDDEDETHLPHIPQHMPPHAQHMPPPHIPERSRYDVGDGTHADYYSNHDDDQHLRKAFNDWFKLAHQEKGSRVADPFHFDMYRIQMSKPPLRSRSRLLLHDTHALQKLNHIRSLQDRLRHIEEMKAALQHKISELERIKEKERNAQLRIENEVSKAQREWKDDVENYHSGYKSGSLW